MMVFLLVSSPSPKGANLLDISPSVHDIIRENYILLILGLLGFCQDGLEV